MGMACSLLMTKIVKILFQYLLTTWTSFSALVIQFSLIFGFYMCLEICGFSQILTFVTSDKVSVRGQYF